MAWPGRDMDVNRERSDKHSLIACLPFYPFQKQKLLENGIAIQIVPGLWYKVSSPWFSLAHSWLLQSLEE